MNLGEIYVRQPMDIAIDLILMYRPFNRIKTQGATIEYFKYINCPEEEDDRDIIIESDNYLMKSMENDSLHLLRMQYRKDKKDLTFCDFNDLFLNKDDTITRISPIGSYHPSHPYKIYTVYTQSSKLSGRYNDTFYVKNKKNQNQSPLIGKYGRDQDLVSFFEPYNENLAGLQIVNKARHFLPNYAYTYGILDCRSFSPLPCKINNIKNYKGDIAVLMQEYIVDSTSLKKFIFENLEEYINHYQEIYLQIFNALSILKMINGAFNHMDLHANNILIKKLNHYVYIPIYHFEKGQLKKIEYLLTKYIIYIIDFGLSTFFDFYSMIRLLHQGKTFEYQNKSHEDIIKIFSGVQYSRNQPKDIFDIIKLLIDILGLGSQFDQKINHPKNIILFEDILSTIFSYILDQNYDLDKKKEYIEIVKKNVDQYFYVVDDFSYVKTYEQMTDFFKQNIIPGLKSCALFTPLEIYSNPALYKIQNSLYLSTNEKNFKPIRFNVAKEFFRMRSHEINTSIEKLSKSISQPTNGYLFNADYFRIFKKFIPNENQVIIKIIFQGDISINTKLQYYKYTTLGNLFAEIDYIFTISGVTRRFQKMLQKGNNMTTISRTHYGNPIILEDGDVIIYKIIPYM